MCVSPGVMMAGCVRIIIPLFVKHAPVWGGSRISQMGEGGVYIKQYTMDIHVQVHRWLPFLLVRDSLRTNIIGGWGDLDPPLGNLSEPAG